MNRTTRISLAILGGIALSAPLLYVLSWKCLAREERLYSFAADSVKVLGLDRWAKSKVVELDGFGGAGSRVQRQLRHALEAQGFQVCVPAETPTSDLCRNVEDVVALESHLDSLTPFQSIVTMSWSESGHGGKYKYGFWWNGLSWSRDTRKDERSDFVIVVQSNYWLKPSADPPSIK